MQKFRVVQNSNLFIEEGMCTDSTYYIIYQGCCSFEIFAKALMHEAITCLSVAQDRYCIHAGCFYLFKPFSVDHWYAHVCAFSKFPWLCFVRSCSVIFEQLRIFCLFWGNHGWLQFTKTNSWCITNVL